MRTARLCSCINPSSVLRPRTIYKVINEIFLPEQDLESDTIGHIDSPETSDALHGESLLDDISSLLGNDLLGALQENTITEDTTTLCALDRPRKKSFKKKLPTSSPSQCGFENRVFNMEKSLDQRYASLAQFEEGSDIARKSFKVGTTLIFQLIVLNINLLNYSARIRLQSVPLPDLPNRIA